MSSGGNYNTWPRRHSGGPSTGTSQSSERTHLLSSDEYITKVKTQIKEVTEIMNDNIDREIERGRKITELKERTREHNFICFIQVCFFW